MISTILTPHVLAAGLAAVALSGPLASPAAAEIRTLLRTQRVCSAQPVSAVLPSWTAVPYKLFVPANTTVPITLTVGVQGEFSLSVNAGPANGSIHYPLLVTTVSGPSTYNMSYPAQATSGEVIVKVGNEFGATATVGLTATTGNASGVCSPLSPRETAGKNCAAKHSDEVQGTVVDPVNTATGNSTCPSKTSPSRAEVPASR